MNISHKCITVKTNDFWSKRTYVPTITGMYGNKNNDDKKKKEKRKKTKTKTKIKTKTKCKQVHFVNN